MPTRPLFHLFSVKFHIQMLQQNNVQIRTQNHLIMKPPPLTTRLELQYLNIIWPKKIFHICNSCNFLTHKNVSDSKDTNIRCRQLRRFSMRPTSILRGNHSQGPLEWKDMR